MIGFDELNKMIETMDIPPISKIAGFIANISSNVAFIPQIIKSYRRKQVEDVSIGMFTVLFCTQICWIVYAVPIGAKNLWISSLIEIALLLPLFAMWFFYKSMGNTTVYQTVKNKLFKQSQAANQPYDDLTDHPMISQRETLSDWKVETKNQQAQNH